MRTSSCPFARVFAKAAKRPKFPKIKNDMITETFIVQSPLIKCRTYKEYFKLLNEFRWSKVSRVF